MTAPFMMSGTRKCALCGATVTFSPEVESGWRMIEIDKVENYLCPAHFPADDASATAFNRAYTRVIRTLLAKR